MNKYIWKILYPLSYRFSICIIILRKMGKEQEEMERAIRSWGRSTTTRGEKEGGRIGEENLRLQNSSGTVWERLIRGSKDKDCPLKESCLVQEWPDSNIPPFLITGREQFGLSWPCIRPIMHPKVRLLEAVSQSCFPQQVCPKSTPMAIWLDLLTDVDWAERQTWNDEENQRWGVAGSYYHLREPREAMVLVEARSWGHQAGSGNLTGSAWRALGRQREGLHESWAQSRESVTARHIYQNRERGAFPLPSSFLSASKASCGINIKGNYWQGTLRLLQD